MHCIALIPFVVTHCISILEGSVRSFNSLFNPPRLTSAGRLNLLIITVLSLSFEANLLIITGLPTDKYCWILCNMTSSTFKCITMMKEMHYTWFGIIESGFYQIRGSLYHQVGGNGVIWHSHTWGLVCQVTWPFDNLFSKKMLFWTCKKWWHIFFLIVGNWCWLLVSEI